MGWRAAKAQMAAGTYDTPGDQEGAGFAEGFASTFAPALVAAAQSYASEKQEKRMLELKEKLLREREKIKSSKSAATALARSCRKTPAPHCESGVPAESST